MNRPLMTTFAQKKESTMQKLQTAKRSLAAIGRRMIHKLSHQLIPNAGTLVMVALLLFVYHAWAAPSTAPQVAPASQVNTGLTDC